MRLAHLEHELGREPMPVIVSRFHLPFDHRREPVAGRETVRLGRTLRSHHLVVPERQGKAPCRRKRRFRNGAGRRQDTRRAAPARRTPGSRAHIGRHAALDHIHAGSPGCVPRASAALSGAKTSAKRNSRVEAVPREVQGIHDDRNITKVATRS